VVDTELFPNTVWAKLAREVLSENTHEVLNVMHPQGQRSLREAIAIYLLRFRGIVADPEQIVVGAGTEMLYTLLIQLLGRNPIYATENPGYVKTRQILQANDLGAIAIPLDASGISVSSLSTSTAQIVHVTPSHQFPSGIIMPIKRRMELLEWANHDLNRYIIEDDYDSEFSVTSQPIPALQGLDQSEKVIYLNSFTKSIAPSLRIGYLVLPVHLLKNYRENQTFGACTVPAFEQAILTKFMMSGSFERHLNRMRIAYKKKRDYLIEQFIHSGIASKNDIIGSDAGLHFLMKVRNGLSEEELVQRAKNVSIRLYGLSEYFVEKLQMSDPTLVIGYSGLTEAAIDEAILRLQDAWK
jgi:GntR family transcriptional regulator/MocR family aminotransferase